MLHKRSDIELQKMYAEALAYEKFGIADSILEATYNNVGDGPTLSKRNKYMIMTHFSHRMTKESIQRMIHEKEFDDMMYL